MLRKPPVRPLRGSHWPPLNPFETGGELRFKGSDQGACGNALDSLQILGRQVLNGPFDHFHIEFVRLGDRDVYL